MRLVLVVLLMQITAQPPTAPIAPPWDKGIQPISRDSYYNAIECGKKGGANPPCVFYDTGLCKNADFTLALFTPYKMVAYEVWRAVRLDRTRRKNREAGDAIARGRRRQIHLRALSLHRTAVRYTPAVVTELDGATRR